MEKKEIASLESVFIDLKYHIQQNFSGSNTDGSFTMAVSNSFLSPLGKLP